MGDFEQLVRDYEKPVYNMALRMSGDPHDAQDLTQEVFLRLYRGLPGFRGEARLSTWIYRVTSNVCIDHARKRAKRREVPLIVPFGDEGDEREWDIPDERYSPEHELDKTLLRESLLAALDRLSPEHKAIVLLRELAGMSYEEIGETLSLGAGTVKSRLNRAREALRRNLYPELASNPEERGGEPVCARK
jgi:RNA polymerase sigma-70 factor (ECF subfamily)